MTRFQAARHVTGHRAPGDGLGVLLLIAAALLLLGAAALGGP